MAYVYSTFFIIVANITKETFFFLYSNVVEIFMVKYISVLNIDGIVEEMKHRYTGKYLFT